MLTLLALINGAFLSSACPFSTIQNPKVKVSACGRVQVCFFNGSRETTEVGISDFIGVSAMLCDIFLETVL